MKLTKKEIERQDFVDNSIFELLQKLNPSDKDIDWNIDIISNVRDIIQLKFLELGISDEMTFYPYLTE